MCIKMNSEMSWTTNKLLSLLPPIETEFIRQHLVPVRLTLGERLFEANDPIGHVFFFEGDCLPRLPEDGPGRKSKSDA